MSYEIISGKVLALAVSLGGYVRISKSERQSAKARFLRGDLPESNALCALIIKGKNINEATEKRNMAKMSLDHPIERQILEEYERDKGKRVDRNLLALTALYEKYPNTDFSDVLKNAKSLLHGIEGSISGVDTIEILCFKPGDTPPKNHNQRISELLNAPVIDILEMHVSEYKTNDPSDLAAICNAGFRRALELEEGAPKNISLALKLGRHYMSNLPGITDASRADWGLPIMDFPNRFSKFLEKNEMADEAMKCIQAAVDNGLSLNTKNGYIGRLEAMKKKYGKLSKNK